MQEQSMINQEAQDHALACPLFARLLGQLTPAFIRLPVVNKNLDEPTQRMALDNIEGAPGHMRGNEITIGFFALVFQRHDEPFSVVGTDIQPGTADEGHHLLSPTDKEAIVSGSIFAWCWSCMIQS